MCALCFREAVVAMVPQKRGCSEVMLLRVPVEFIRDMFGAPFPLNASVKHWT